MLTDLLSMLPMSPIEPFSERFLRKASFLGSNVSLTYLGTAGFVFSNANRRIVVDPYITRPSLTQHLWQRLSSNEELVRKWIPLADDVLVGHAHHDHVLDAPCLCHQTGARLIGSSDVATIGRAAGLAEHQILATQGRERISCGESAHIQGIPSAHGKVYFGRVPLAGPIPSDFKWPSYYWQFKHGQVLNWYIEMDGLRFMHVDSAEFFASEWEGLEVDVLCLCAIGRAGRPNYIEEAISLLKPKIVLACHWDCFWVPLENQTHYLLPNVDLDGFIEEVEHFGAQPMVLSIGETIRL